MQNAQPFCACIHAKVTSVVSDSWPVAHQAPLSMRFSRQEHRNGLPCPPPGNLPNLGIRLCLFHLLHWQAGSLQLGLSEKPQSFSGVKVFISPPAYSSFCPTVQTHSHQEASIVDHNWALSACASAFGVFINTTCSFPRASHVALVVKNLPANAGDRRDVDFWVGKIPQRRAWQPPPEFLPRESHE